MRVCACVRVWGGVCDLWVISLVSWWMVGRDPALLSGLFGCHAELENGVLGLGWSGSELADIC